MAETVVGSRQVKHKYTIPVWLNNAGTLTDATTWYCGLNGNTSTENQTTEDESNIYVYKACTIKAANIRYYFSIGAGTSEDWSIYIRKNSTTDTLIQTVSSTANPRVWTNTGLSISLASGDYFIIKVVNPTWSTNPSTSATNISIVIEIEYQE